MTGRLQRLLRLPTAVAVVGALVVGGCQAAQADDGGDTARFLVRTTGAVASEARLDRSTAVDVEGVRPLAGDLAVVTVDLRGGGADAAAQALADSPLIASATADRRVALLGARSPVTPSDAYFDSQWDLWDAESSARAGGYGIDASRAWLRTQGSSSVVVAVLDSGITAHPQLAGASLAPGYDFVSGGGGVGTGDGDGWDADPADPGDACRAEGEASSWHGTFVTSEIAAQHGRGGVAGASSGVTVEPVRVLGSCGGSEADTIAAIEWASGGVVPGVPVNARPADVITLSLGSSGSDCPAPLQAAVSDAIGRGAVVVAAAGNTGTAIAPVSPANCAGVVSVAASTRTGRLAGYSNHGTAELSPTIAAPGGSDDDPVLGAGWSSSGAFTAKGNSAIVTAAEGTSMAAPRVASAVALLLSVRPAATPADVTALLTATATPFPKASGCSAVRCGPGIVNAGELVGAAKRFVRIAKATAGGRAKVGIRLTASPGRWRAAPQRTRFTWLRDGRPIARATSAGYRVRAADRGHVLAVRVQVQRDGWASETTTSAGRRIPR